MRPGNDTIPPGISFYAALTLYKWMASLRADPLVVGVRKLNGGKEVVGWERLRSFSGVCVCGRRASHHWRHREQKTRCPI
jgi:hypothetical protein